MLTRLPMNTIWTCTCLQLLPVCSHLTAFGGARDAPKSLGTKSEGRAAPRAQAQVSVGVQAKGLAVARGCVRAAAQRELPEGALARRELLVVGSWAGGP